MAPLLKRTADGMLKPPESTTRPNTIDHQPSAFEMYASQYEERLGKRDSELRKEWANIMGQGRYAAPLKYKNVHVLMLSWDTAEDDLKVQEEVDMLRSVLSDDYHYHVRYERLQGVSDKRTQNQLNWVVAGFVHECDAPNTLLIVYFAGHGSDVNGSLEISGKLHSLETLDRVTWNQTEANLQNTHADILQIFDCCSAGSLGGAGRSHVTDQRAYEYLGATSSRKLTPKPGKTSFTRALIWALKEFKRESRAFTTFDLRQKIWREAPDFSRDQEPTLHKSSKFNHSECIILRPLEFNNAIPATTKDEESHLPRSHVQETLTLRMIFDREITEADIKSIGKYLNEVNAAENLRINRIQWGGVSVSVAMKAVNKFKELRARNGSIGRLTQAAVQETELVLPTDHEPTVADKFEEDITERVQAKVEDVIHERIGEEIHERIDEFMAHTASQRAKDRVEEEDHLQKVRESDGA